MSDLTPFESLFSTERENRFYLVPSYQRMYSWEKEQRNDLLEDIEQLERDIRERGPQAREKHFMGTIVAAQPSSDEIYYDLVDGQQRITSLLLLMARLLFKFEEMGVEYITYDHTVSSAREKFICYTESLGNSKPRLVLNEDSANEVFEKLVINNKLIESEEGLSTKAEASLVRAAHEFERSLDKLSYDELFDRFETIRVRLGFIFYEAENSSEIGLMFEVINSRGKELSELDKVKNFLLYYASRFGVPNLAHHVERVWPKVLQNLNSIGFTSHGQEQTFLQSCWVVFGDSRARKSGPVYEGLKEEYLSRDVNTGYRDLVRFVEVLERASITFRELYKKPAVGRQLDSEESHLEALSWHPRIASVLPLLVALYDKGRDERDEVPKEKRVKVLEVLEKLNFRFYVLKVAGRTDSQQGELFRLAHDYFNATDEFAEMVDRTDFLAERLRRFVLRNAGLKRVVKNLILEEDEGWDFYDWRGLKFFLASYEQHLSERRKQWWPLGQLLAARDPSAQNNSLQLEHLIAQNDTENVDEEVGEFVKRRLGNFVLLREGTNKSVSDAPVKQKIRRHYPEVGARELYQVDELDGILSDVEATLAERWQRDVKGFRVERQNGVVDERERRLVRFAMGRWGIEGDVFSPEDVSVDWMLGNGLRIRSEQAE